MSNDISAELLAKRVVSKASGFYANSDWDLVDAFRDGEVAAEELGEMEEAALPEPMQGMTTAQKLEFLEQKKAERKSIQQQILELSESRATYVAERKLEQVAAAPSVSDAFTGAIRKQAAVKNFTFNN